MDLLLLPLKLISRIERVFYKIRDAFWTYPEIFSLEKSYNKKIIKSYQSAVPYSHFFVAFLFFLSLTFFLLNPNFRNIIGTSKKVMFEAVVMGVNSDGLAQKINKINPILPSNVQLEKDLVNLLYEPLIKYTFVKGSEGLYGGGVQTILAEDIITILPGANYEFTVKKGIEWHDSTDNNKHYLTADDVIATFELYSSLDENIASNIYTKTLKQLQWAKIDDYTIKICTKPNIRTDNVCDNDKDASYPIFSNFLELISFKILPKKYASEISSSNIDSSAPLLYRKPIGTGLFKINEVDPSSITLSVNEKHRKYSEKMDIHFIQFIYYKTLEDAVSALQNAEVHSLATTSIKYKDRLEEYKQIKTYVSNVLYNQFWALYFNLRTKPDGSSIAPEFLQDVRVRQAISSAIDRENIVSETLRNTGSEAIGPIPKISFFFNKEAGWFDYNILRANRILDKTDWKFRNGDKFRTNKKGEVLSFSLFFVNSFDRKEVAKAIKNDLAKIGVDVKINKSDQINKKAIDKSFEEWTLQEINDQVLSPGLFDVIIYGMQTFIDPDRYELYHSSQTRYPGLNISGYESSEKTVDKREERKEGESSVIQVPKVDRFLDLARSFNPETGREARKDRYFSIQEIIAKDVPAAFLYHPQYLYFCNKALSNIILSGNSIEDRFVNIQDWKFK